MALNSAIGDGSLRSKVSLIETVLKIDHLKLDSEYIGYYVISACSVCKSQPRTNS